MHPIKEDVDARLPLERATNVSGCQNSNRTDIRNAYGYALLRRCCFKIRAKFSAM